MKTNLKGNFQNYCTNVSISNGLSGFVNPDSTTKARTKAFVVTEIIHLQNVLIKENYARQNAHILALEPASLETTVAAA